MNVIIISLISITILLTSCVAPSPKSQQAVNTKAQTSQLPKQFKARQILVTLAAKDKSRWSVIEQELLRDYPLIKSGAFPLDSLGIQCLVFIISEQSEMPKLVAQLLRDGRVESVQNNSVFMSQSAQYSDQYAKLQHGFKQIGVDRVHHQFTGKGVKIAIIDTGIDIEHPDLANQVALQENFVEKGDESFTSDRHGTAIAGVIAAIANNDIGIYGVAPDAQLVGLKSCFYQAEVNNYAICSSWSLAKALDFAILQAVDIVNLSLSGPHDNLLARIINEGQKREIIFVAATDDRNHQVGFPASIPDVIAVASSEDEGNNEFSPMKNKNMLLAPGKEIISTAPRNKYDFFSGSSLATAIVSGSIALLKEKNPNLSVDEVTQLLKNPGPINICGALMTSC
jgi:Subtilase family